MSFVVFADGTANLPKSMLEGIQLLPCTYTLDEQSITYDGDVEKFDGTTFYESLKAGKDVKTTLLNTYLFIEEFEPILKNGQDVIYVSMSSGISGTFNAARLAKEELEEKYPERKVVVIDSHGCGFGSGLLAVKAVELSKAGKETNEAETILNEAVPHACQYFTVDDLNFLKKTGRVSGAAATFATIMNIKPILYGDETGHIVGSIKVKGRKAAIDALTKKYEEKVVDAPNQTVCISHGNCLEDAQKLAEQIKAIANPKEVVICMHEPFSGCHVGPGMLGLFFFGKER